MAARKLHQQAREKVIARTDHRDIELAACDALELGKRFLGFVELTNDCAAVAQQLFAGRREEDALAQLLEQHQPDVPLQGLDLGRHGRLRQMQFLGRARKTQMSGHRFKDFQLPQGGVLHSAFQSKRAVADAAAGAKYK